MAYTPATLFRMTGGNKTQGPSLWLYKTTDSIYDVRAPGYFSGGIVSSMNVGDIVITSSPTQSQMSIGMVATIVAGVVTVDQFF